MSEPSVCQRCQTPLKDGDRVCAFCGQSVEAVPPPVLHPAAPDPATQEEIIGIGQPLFVSQRAAARRNAKRFREMIRRPEGAGGWTGLIVGLLWSVYLAIPIVRNAYAGLRDARISDQSTSAFWTPSAPTHFAEWFQTCIVIPVAYAVSAALILGLSALLAALGQRSSKKYGSVAPWLWIGGIMILYLYGQWAWQATHPSPYTQQR